MPVPVFLKINRLLHSIKARSSTQAIDNAYGFGPAVGGEPVCKDWFLAQPRDFAAKRSGAPSLQGTPLSRRDYSIAAVPRRRNWLCTEELKRKLSADPLGTRTRFPAGTNRLHLSP